MYVILALDGHGKVDMIYGPFNDNKQAQDWIAAMDLNREYLRVQALTQPVRCAGVN